MVGDKRGCIQGGVCVGMPGCIGMYEGIQGCMGLPSKRRCRFLERASTQQNPYIVPEPTV